MKQIITFGPKFCQAQLSLFLKETLKNETDGSPISEFKKSFAEHITEVVFDLSLTEWVSTEEIVFLFAWIRNIKSLKDIKVILPFRQKLSVALATQKLSNPKYDWYLSVYLRDNGVPYRDDEDSLKRRKRSSAFLMAAYGMLDKIGLDQYDFENLADFAVYNAEVTRLRENNHQIIPFTEFDLSSHKQNLKFDSHYNNVINNNLNAGNRTGKIFDLQNDVFKLLDKYACYSPFESKILSNIITQELYINSLQHAHLPEAHTYTLPECYIVAFLANKWDYPSSEKFNPSFLNEKLPESLDFYKDKEAIKADINEVLKKPKHANTPSRQADLSRYNSKFKNLSYLEYTFLDLGTGIHSSLKPSFLEAESKATVNKKHLSKGFEDAHQHSKILEYAFMMDTSKYPLEEIIDNYELVPRGLYFLVDMVRRYKGLLCVQSGFGQIVYDFSDKLEISNTDKQPVAKLKPVLSIADAVIHQKKNDAVFFPGTMFSIVLPEKEGFKAGAKKDLTMLTPVRAPSITLAKYAYSLTDKMFKNPGLPSEEFQNETFEYVSILFIYNNIIEDFKRSDREINVKDIYNQLFVKINGVLDKFQEQRTIIFFDFSGLKGGNMTWIKILYFLVNSPKINEFTKAVIVNLPGDEDHYLSVIRENLRGQAAGSGNPDDDIPFLYRPIPCINFQNTFQPEESMVKWIGLKSVEDEPLLTSLLLGKAKGNSVKESMLNNPENVEGSFFIRDEQRIYTTFGGLTDLRGHFFQKQKAAIRELLYSHIEQSKDGIGKKSVFLASNGGYQYKYLSLYELLHDQLMARYFAKALLDKYCHKLTTQNILPDDYQRNFHFDKIVVVTVSSQLIGVAIRDLITEDSKYKLLIDRKPPELIILSSYYSFDSEKPFENIRQGDRVLIVNDVISTGNLVKRLWEKIEDRKEAIVNAVFTIADTRKFKPDTGKIRKKRHTEIISEKFSGDKEAFVYSLTSTQDGFVITKYKGPYQGDAVQKRINPLLNTVVDLGAEHAEQCKIIYPQTINFLKENNINPEHLKIGHFKQNQVHNCYVTDMIAIFSGQPGLDMIQRVKCQLDSKITHLDCDQQQTQHMQDLKKIMEKIIKYHKEQNLLKKMKDLNEEIDNFLACGLLEEKNEIPRHYCPDFIFYPVFSSIEKLDPVELARIFNTHADNIIGLQRFDTQKGWRFPFPAKRLTLLTRNKSVLILDSGSLTGESLVQLIDNVCFLEVRKIVVLTIITRIEDFYREYYSRIRKIHVMRDGVSVNLADQTGEKVIPIDILFGINLHIPVYAVTTACPFCKELAFFKEIRKSHKDSLTKRVKGYITQREKEIALQDLSVGSMKNISYLPVSRDTGKVDTVNLFHMRDMLGKIDSYRFYPDYFEEFNLLQQRINKNSDWLSDQDILRDLELIMACLVHEPFLIQLIRNYINGIFYAIEKIVSHLLTKGFNLDIFYYEWEIYPLIRICELVSRNQLFKLETFERILLLEDSRSEDFLMYKFWEILAEPDMGCEDQTNVYLLLKTFNDRFSAETVNTEIHNRKNREFCKMMYNQINVENLSGHRSLAAHFNNLSNFVYKNENRGNHFELTHKLNDLFLSIESPTKDIEKIMSSFERIKDIFLSQLKPSLVTISKNQMIQEYLEEIHNVFASKEHGLLPYIERLENIYDILLKATKDTLDDFEDQFAEISEIYDVLINRILKLDEKNICFYSLCKQYPCSLKESLEALDLKYAGKGISITVNLGTYLDKDYQIAFHKLLLDSILDEIMSNAKKAFDSKGQLELHFTVKVMEERIVLDISQNNTFRKPSGEGGRTNIIKYFVQELHGWFHDNSNVSMASAATDTPVSYLMTLEFARFKFTLPTEEDTLEEINFQNN